MKTVVTAVEAMELAINGVDALRSNIGHLLRTGILSSKECGLVANRLNGPDLNSGFGLRALAASSRGFNPLSYRCGPVWAHDTAIAIDGLARIAGETARQAVCSLTDGLLSAAEAFRYRLPELYGGQARSGPEGPLLYPASCHPQAWSAGASIFVLAAPVGMQPDVCGTGPVPPRPHPAGLRTVEGLSIGCFDASVYVDTGGTARLPVGR